jgi:hypothetical protein
MVAPPKDLRNTYVAPVAPYLRPIIICGIVMALVSRREVIAPLAGSSYFRYAKWAQDGLFYFLYGAHAIETAVFTKRLSRHGVSVQSAAWWKWIGTCFVGGKYCFVHFDRLVGKYD